jgi:hypothetical protein
LTVSSEKTVKYKLVLGFLLVIVMFVSFGIISLREVHTVGTMVHRSRATINQPYRLVKISDGVLPG